MRHVVITGGASGIGEAVATRVIRAGHRVTLLDRQAPEESSPLSALSTEQVRAVEVDVTDPDAVSRAVSDAWDWQSIDGLVTSAGVVARGVMLDEENERFEQVMSVNLGGTVNAVRSVLTHSVGSNRPCSMVVLASTAAVGYVAGLATSYHVSKAAVVGLVHSVAGDYAAHGIRINAIAPGVVHTPMTRDQLSAQGVDALSGRAPAGRLAEADDVAAVAEWLLSDHSRLTTGWVFPVDGGQTAVTGGPAAGFPLGDHFQVGIPVMEYSS